MAKSPFFGQRLGGMQGDEGPVAVRQPGAPGAVAVPGGGPGHVRMRGLGDAMQNPERWQTAPPVDDMPFRAEIKGEPSGTIVIPKNEIIGPEELRKLAIVRTIPPVARQVIITPVPISVNDPKRIDSGVANRLYVLIQNMSTTVMWVNTHGGVQAAFALGQMGNGFPLGPASAPAAYNGGAIMLNAGPEVEFWAVPQAGVSQYVVVIETAR